MSDAQWDSYDEVPYDAKAFAHTHPDVLATMATIFGMSPPPVETCRAIRGTTAEAVCRSRGR